MLKNIVTQQKKELKRMDEEVVNLKKNFEVILKDHAKKVEHATKRGATSGGAKRKIKASTVANFFEDIFLLAKKKNEF